MLGRMLVTTQSIEPSGGESHVREDYIAKRNSQKVFAAVHAEKERRSNIDKDDGRKHRKPSRYSSKRDGPQPIPSTDNKEI